MNTTEQRRILLADDIEARAFADLYAAAPAPLQRQLGLQVETIGDTTALIAPGLPATMFNRVIGLGQRLPASPERVEQLVRRYRDAGVERWWLHVGPAAAPAGLAEALLQRGFSAPPRRAWAKMWRSVDSLPPVRSDLTVGPASDAQVAACCTCITQVFGLPPFMPDWLAALHRRPGWTVYSIQDGAQTVGGACLFVDGGAGWLGMGAVQPSHRRRGGQQASMVQRIADAALQGCSEVITETGEAIGDEPNPSLANMHRVGFSRVAQRLNLEFVSGR